MAVSIILHIMKKKSFTLIEIVISLAVFWIIFGVLFTIFLRVIRTKTDIEARQALIKSTYDVVEQMNTKLQNYTIDYEEYFNRTEVGCTIVQDWSGVRKQGAAFSWNIQESGSIAGNCSTWTAYGNRSPFIAWYDNHVLDGTKHKLYVCSSDTSVPPAPLTMLTLGNVYGSSWWAFPEERLLVPYVLWDRGCQDRLFDFYDSALPGSPFTQPYGEYATQFLDVKWDVDDTIGRSGDDDDTNSWIWPDAIWDNTNIKELYLISKDKLKRIFFRRALLATWDRNGNGTIDTDNEKLYTIQMLQLKAFDAGMWHDFDSLTYSWVYDGTTDTRACDTDAGFVCTWPSLWGIYSGYFLPANANDGWVNLLSSDVSVADWNMQIFPIKNPELSRWEPQYQTNPFIRLYIKTTVYWENRAGRIWVNNLDDVTFDVQTSFNIKTNY